MKYKEERGGLQGEVEMHLILGRIFDRASSPLDEKTTAFYDSGSESSAEIEAQYNSSGRLYKLTVLGSADEGRYLRLLNYLRKPVTSHVSRRPFFSYRKVEGAWRYRDLFQISPAPVNAPRPSMGLLSKLHPCILEVSCKNWSDDLLNINQADLETRQFELLLAALLIGPRWRSTRPYFAAHFVRDPRSVSGEDVRTVHAQELYMIPNFERFAETFSEQPRTLPTVGDNEYWTWKYFNSHEELGAPERFAFLLDQFFSLSSPERDTFLRACYWLGAGESFSEDSGSMSLMCLVMAIEALIKKDTNSHICSECEEKHYPSITRAFKDFLKNFVPESPERQDFYAARSKIAHGDHLFLEDRSATGFMFHRTDFSEQWSRRNMVAVCRVGLTNWLSAGEHPHVPVSLVGHA